ncbi:hypothetical protein B0H34DRAFT_520730 [Crassisporium funariophilum]|nr:hypothetical protein B0H34DRAFT_520730 [Crassisporium funariophilum]
MFPPYGNGHSTVYQSAYPYNMPRGGYPASHLYPTSSVTRLAPPQPWYTYPGAPDLAPPSQAWTPYASVPRQFQPHTPHHAIVTPAPLQRGPSDEIPVMPVNTHFFERYRNLSMASVSMPRNSRLVQVGRRMSIVHEQVPEIIGGQGRESVWDSAIALSLDPTTNRPQKLMMVKNIQFRHPPCYPRVEWDVNTSPSAAKEHRSPTVYGALRHHNMPVILAELRGDICIKTTQSNSLAHCLKLWGCVVIQLVPGKPTTVEQLLYEIWDYFHTPIKHDDYKGMPPGSRALIINEVNKRQEMYPSGVETMLEINRALRIDALFGLTRFAGLKMCPFFAVTGDLYLFLKPSEV